MCSCLLAHAHACKLMLMNQHACPPGKDDEMFGFGQQLLLDTYLGKMILGKLHEIKTTFGKKNSQITRRLEYLIHMSKFTQEIEIYAQFFGKISVNLGLTTCEKMDFLHKFHLHCKHSWPSGESKIGWYHQKPPQGMLRNQNWPNNILRPFPLDIFIIINHSFHVYPLHSRVYGLKFYWNKNKWETTQFCIPNCHGPFKNHTLEF